MRQFWDFSVPDWQDRIRAGMSIMPNLPLDESEADRAEGIFGNLKIPDVVGTPLLRDVGGPWYKEIVRALFGSVVDGRRKVREIFTLVPKKNGKTTYSAGLMITALLMNEQPRAEFLMVGPTKEVAELAFNQAVGMIEADSYLKKRFKPVDHRKEIYDRITKSKLKIKAFDENVLVGTKPAGVLIDELHVIAKQSAAARIMRQVRSGMLPNRLSFCAIITTQSDQEPTGVFLSDLRRARKIRDGALVDVEMLPILYELPDDIAKDEDLWRNPQNWTMVNPNIGRGFDLSDLIQLYNEAKEDSEAAEITWASQHLNIQVGLGIKTDTWIGAKWWLQRAVDITLEQLIERSEVIVIGIDGGGRDDLLGLAVLGREIGTRRWLLWNRAWAHEVVLERRKEIAGRLTDFVYAGEMEFVTDEDGNKDIREVCDIIEQCAESGKLAEKGAIGVDRVGITDIVDELVRRGFSVETGDGKGQIREVIQGWRLSGSIKTLERRLSMGEVVHADQGLMNWALGNAKAIAKGNAIAIDKATSGSAKIDPLIATFNAVELMVQNPEPPGRSVYAKLAEMKDDQGRSNDIDWEILDNPRHPKFFEERQKYYEVMDAERLLQGEAEEVV